MAAPACQPLPETRRATTDRPRIGVHVSIPRVPPAAAAGDAPADDASPTCGWFESSWSLRQGLAVQELGPSELPDDGTVAALLLAALGAPAAPSAAWQ